MSLPDLSLCFSGWALMERQRRLAPMSSRSVSKQNEKLTDGGKKSTMRVSETNSALAVQEGGGHYKGFVIQPIEYCMRNNLDHCQSNVVKYVSRFRDKGGMEDLRKARHYLELLAEFEYNERL
jgi:hypothetical protein